MRQTISEIQTNNAYRWFIGYGLSKQIPHLTTFGKNYVRRFKDTDIFEQVFVRVLEEAVNAGLIKGDAVFIDATHVKANANKKKYDKVKLEKEYKSDPLICKSCPYLNICTGSKDCTKLVSRHIWARYMEEAEHLRHTDLNKEIYARRKETIERVFADMKEKHGMRWTTLRGLERVSAQAMLVAACMN